MSSASRARWGSPYWDDEHSGYAGKLVEDADALLLGRETYEGFVQGVAAARRTT